MGGEGEREERQKETRKGGAVGTRRQTVEEKRSIINEKAKWRIWLRARGPVN